MSALVDKFSELRGGYPEEMASSLVLPLLQLTQEAKGHLTESDAVFIADYLGVPAMQVVEALSWYTMLYREPVGRHVIKVCRNISCSLTGGGRLMGYLERRLGVRQGGTTADGRFTLLAVECLASCGTAPAMQVNDTYHERLTEARIDQILKELP
ncbi:MAG: NAD(P)H-dependent oxidoreductase subunit E [Desulfuromonadales bacterium]|nr:MAG: NAD(P)H-dependent oxidoreductase subunit E [Desulfuromonadales bacterium]